jgi:hypothetical protein
MFRNLWRESADRSEAEIPVERRSHFGGGFWST